MEDGISARGPPRANNVVGKAPSIETVVVSLLSTRQFNLAIGSPRRPRGPNRLVLNSSVKPIKWDHPPMDSTALGLDVAQSIINFWNSFNQRDAYVSNMCALPHQSSNTGGGPF